MPAGPNEEYDELGEAVRRIHSIVELVYGQDLGRIMDCQNAIEACLKACTGENDAEEMQFELYLTLKKDYPEVIGRINEIVDGRRQNQ